MHYARKLLCCLLLTVSAGLLSADSVVVPSASGSSWQNWSTSVLTENLPDGVVRPFWDHPSWGIGYNSNVGSCLTGSAACRALDQPGALPYLGSPAGASFSNFYFRGSGEAVTVAMDAQMASDTPYSSIGWYDITNPNLIHILFSGNVANGSSVSFTPSSDYGFVFLDTMPGAEGVYFTQAQLQSTDQGFQHFSVFEDTPGVYYLGIEDRPSWGSDLDFKDMIIKVSTQPVPEPMNISLLGVGLVALGMCSLVDRDKRRWK